jgi:hypothetical protein
MGNSLWHIGNERPHETFHPPRCGEGMMMGKAFDDYVPCPVAETVSMLLSAGARTEVGALCSEQFPRNGALVTRSRFPLFISVFLSLTCSSK